MSRLMLAAAPSAGPQVASTSADQERGHGLARLARALRDAGHEVIHAGQGLTDAVVVAAAVQEDVAAVVLLAPPSYDVTALAAELAGGAEDPGPAGDEEVALVPVGLDEQPDRVVQRVAERLALRVGDDTPYDGLDEG